MLANYHKNQILSEHSFSINNPEVFQSYTCLNGNM